jgi:hypothetical protein
MKKNAHYIQNIWNLVIIPSGIFIVDHACETMHNACKSGALLRKFAFRANTTKSLPTVGGEGGDGTPSLG